MSAEVVRPAAGGGAPVWAPPPPVAEPHVRAIPAPPAPVVLPAGRERRRIDPLGVLSRRMDGLCTRAVDPGEIAAGLESAGITDTEARTRYGVRDVFALADALFRLVPRRPGPAPGGPDPWWMPTRRLLLRGILFALPGLLFAAALPARTGPAEVALLTAGLLTGWATGQGLAYAGHVLRGRGEVRAARRWLGRGTALTVVVCAAAAAAALPFAADRAVLLAAGLVVYMVAAAALLVEGRELALLGVLLPGTVTTALLAGRGTGPWAGAGAVVTLVALLVLVAARYGPAALPGADRGGTHLAGGTGAAALSPPDRSAARWHAGYGLAAATAVSLPQLMAVRSGAAFAGAAVLPLMLSSGTAEWLVHRTRSRGRRLAAVVPVLPVFRRRVRRLLLRGLAVHTATAAVTAALVLAVAVPSAGAGPGATLATAVVPVAYVLAAVALGAALTAMSCGRVRGSVLLMGAGTAAGLLAVALLPEGVLPAVLHPLVVPALLVPAQVGIALRAVGDPHVHV